MTKFRHIAFSLSAASILSGCLLPEKFTASVTVGTDESVQYQYKGTAAFGLYFMMKAKGQSVSAKDDQAMEREAKKASGPGQSLKYIGEGRVNADVDIKLAPNQKSTEMQFFTYKKNGDQFEIRASEIKPGDMHKLKAANYRPEGTFEVKLPSGAKVVKHNADSTPDLLSKSYKWTIKSFDSPASITFTIK